MEIPFCSSKFSSRSRPFVLTFSLKTTFQVLFFLVILLKCNLSPVLFFVCVFLSTVKSFKKVCKSEGVLILEDFK